MVLHKNCKFTEFVMNKLASFYHTINSSDNFASISHWVCYQMLIVGTRWSELMEIYTDGVTKLVNFYYEWKFGVWSSILTGICYNFPPCLPNYYQWTTNNGLVCLSLSFLLLIFEQLTQPNEVHLIRFMAKVLSLSSNFVIICLMAILGTLFGDLNVV